MSKILLYTAGKACVAMQCIPTTATDGYQVNAYKDINGNSYNTIYFYTYSTSNYNNIMKGMQFYANLTGYCSADTEDDFSLDHYTTREIADLTYERTVTAQRGGRTYTIKVTNNGDSDVSVGSMKFTKAIYAPAESAGDKTCLILGVFFDSPVTISAGETKLFAIAFNT